MTVSTLSIRCYSHSPNISHYEYDVSFNNTVILTTITNSPSVAYEWISVTESIHHGGHETHYGRSLLVGLDTEWQPLVPGYPVAILQLCVENRYLIFQLLWACHVPQSLTCFLSHHDHVFVGVGIGNDAQKLRHDFGLEVTKTVDLATLAPSQLAPLTELPSNPGLKFLAVRVLGADMGKPKGVTMSHWDDAKLSAEQVQYACVDAYVSSRLGGFGGRGIRSA